MNKWVQYKTNAKLEEIQERAVKMIREMEISLCEMSLFTLCQ